MDFADFMSLLLGLPTSDTVGPPGFGKRLRRPPDPVRSQNAAGGGFGGKLPSAFSAR
jgi:hypothetical protein